MIKLLTCNGYVVWDSSSVGRTRGSVFCYVCLLCGLLHLSFYGDSSRSFSTDNCFDVTSFFSFFWTCKRCVKCITEYMLKGNIHIMFLSCLSMCSTLRLFLTPLQFSSASFLPSLLICSSFGLFFTTQFWSSVLSS